MEGELVPRSRASPRVNLDSEVFLLARGVDSLRFELDDATSSSLSLGFPVRRFHMFSFCDLYKRRRRDLGIMSSGFALG